ncbi:MAG: heme-binding protein [Mycobacteriaceae bacterium]|nr:heme-binding protein [Mycobacteriaceae bacterium]MBV9640590.1 heme-binding protein [Mycobacteriaceae bacterium]
MLFSSPTVHGAIVATVGAAAIAGMMFSGASSASAQPAPPAPLPPDCNAANLARVSAGVASATADYLDSHPDVNNFLTGLHGLPNDEIPTDVRNYMNANPQVQSDLTAIRQPLTDLRNRCQ